MVHHGQDEDKGDEFGFGVLFDEDNDEEQVGI